MNIKDMYSVFEHDGKFAIRMLTWNNRKDEYPHWSYLYFADISLWVDKWSFIPNYGFPYKLKYFSSEKEAQEYINSYIKDIEDFECF